MPTCRHCARKTRFFITTLMVLCVFAISFSPAARADLVTNGGFETGFLTGWTPFGVVDNIYVCGTQVTCAQVPGFFFDPTVHSGNDALAFDANFAGIQQTLTTVPGEAYDFSFWVKSACDLPCTTNSLTVSLSTPTSSTTVFAGSDLGRSDFIEYTYTDFIATDTSTVLILEGASGPFLIDDISVTPDTDAAAITPEPATLVTAGSGLMAALIAGLRRRRHTTSA